MLVAECGAGQQGWDDLAHRDLPDESSGDDLSRSRTRAAGGREPAAARPRGHAAAASTSPRSRQRWVFSDHQAGDPSCRLGVRQGGKHIQRRSNTHRGLCWASSTLRRAGSNSATSPSIAWSDTDGSGPCIKREAKVIDGPAPPFGDLLPSGGLGPFREADGQLRSELEQGIEVERGGVELGRRGGEERRHVERGAGADPVGRAGHGCPAAGARAGPGPGRRRPGQARSGRVTARAAAAAIHHRAVERNARRTCRPPGREDGQRRDSMIRS